MKRRLIVFDLDGTLNKTENYAVPAIAEALEDFGIYGVSREEIIETFGAKDEDTNVRFFGERAGELGGAFWEKVRAYISGKYSDSYEAYDGVKELLRWLKKEGYETAVCSNNASLNHITSVLEKIGVLSLIDEIQPVAVGRTKDEALKELLERQKPESAILAGDRFYDRDAARSNGIEFAACLYGYGRFEEFDGAKVLLERPEDLILYLYQRDKKPCRLIVLDIDGTLTNSEKEITEATLKTLFKARQSGAEIVLASGRPVHGIMPVADKLNLKEHGGYILAFNGGIVLDCRSGENIFLKEIPHEMAGELKACADEFSLALLSYEDGYIISEKPDDIYVQKESVINGLPVKKIDDFSTYVNFPVTKCIMTGDGEKLEKIEKIMQKRFEGRLSIYRSEPYFLEIMPLGIDKANSLRFLLDTLRADKEEMIAFGDGHNDVTMLEFAGLGIAMANAQEAVREKADFVTLGNDEDGVAYAVKRLMELPE